TTERKKKQQITSTIITLYISPYIKQTLQQILAQLQGLTARLARNPPPTIQPVPQGPDPVLAEQPVAAAPPSAHLVEPPLPAPMRYGGEPGGCRGFLLQCSLAFELQPSRFQSERAKVAYIVSLLTGKALAWATPVWVHQPGVCTTAMLFAEALSRTFDLPVRGEEAGARLLNLRQGRRSVSEYAIEFHTLAAESGWNASALASAFHHGLNEDLKDELAHRDSPTTLDDLIELTQRLDNRLRERYRVRTGDGPPSPTGNRGRPVQLRHTRLSQEERDTRMRDGRCLYCGTAGHQRTDCPQLVLKRQHPLGGEEPLTDRPGFPRTTGVFLNATLACGDSEVRLPAFLDSGAAGNFLDAATARKLALPLVRLREPLPIEAIDGRSLEPGMVSHQTRPLTLRVGSHSEQITLFIISAPDLQLVLGFPWLQRHNPHVDWLSRSVLAWGPACRTSCLQPSQAPRGTNLDPEAADLSRVPTDYHDLGEVFSKKKAQILPPHRPCDMAIDLLPGTSPPRGRLFSLSGPERRAMEEYIQEALALGFIRPSSSPAGAGFFFVGKKDGYINEVLREALDSLWGQPGHSTRGTVRRPRSRPGNTEPGPKHSSGSWHGVRDGRGRGNWDRGGRGRGNWVRGGRGRGNWVRGGRSRGLRVRGGRGRGHRVRGGGSRGQRWYRGGESRGQR
uniref:CCHC-type domain-containing protein n=1 Tax=Astyanax mexicanus TaxID=7994 RepID=A0A3B1K1V9_ASTMX